jgi:hypothetical protein
VLGEVVVATFRMMWLLSKGQYYGEKAWVDIVSMHQPNCVFQGYLQGLNGAAGVDGADGCG